MTDEPSPPPGFWENLHALLHHERELWEAGIDPPHWWRADRTEEPSRAGDLDPQ
ncbi:hypothetical protein [Gordonia tangerina]|uniref:Uncharacterized protein n=1 Tax=Gordonia tangerina TaxID=2911060 RepID=A0ABS9DEZ5_9ACTN|nr:hypothetical protein [Gordonia tangerina]MCF3937179.1 hypothetical protein [Gordonia tangerina]